MRYALIVALMLSGVAAAQEKQPPKDSERISVPGCSNDRRFIVATAPEGEPVRSTMRPGRRLKLSGAKTVLNEIKRQEGTMIEVTGLVRKGQLAESGVSAAGGRVRVGGGPPREALGGVGHDPGYNEVIIDVESWRPLPATCRSN